MYAAIFDELFSTDSSMYRYFHTDTEPCLVVLCESGSYTELIHGPSVVLVCDRLVPFSSLQPSAIARHHHFKIVVALSCSVELMHDFDLNKVSAEFCHHVLQSAM